MVQAGFGDVAHPKLEPRRGTQLFDSARLVRQSRFEIALRVNHQPRLVIESGEGVDHEIGSLAVGIEPGVVEEGHATFLHGAVRCGQEAVGAGAPGQVDAVRVPVESRLVAARVAEQQIVVAEQRQARLRVVVDVRCRADPEVVAQQDRWPPLLLVEQHEVGSSLEEPAPEVAQLERGVAVRRNATGPGHVVAVPARVAACGDLAAARVDQYLVLVAQHVAVLA